jgi:hypothetical protein
MDYGFLQTSSTNAINRFRLADLQVSEKVLEPQVLRTERKNAPAPPSQDGQVDFDFVQTLPDAQYDDDIEDEESKGMKAKVGDHYVTGMRGDERIIHKHHHEGTPKSMVGGCHIDLV